MFDNILKTLVVFQKRLSVSTKFLQNTPQLTSRDVLQDTAQLKHCKKQLYSQFPEATVIKKFMAREYKTLSLWNNDRPHTKPDFWSLFRSAWWIK